MTGKPKVFTLEEMERNTKKDPHYPGCLIWSANAIGPHGQAVIVRNGRHSTVIQHYMAAMDVPRGIKVKRLCRTHGCVAPEHHWWEGKRFKRGKV